MRTRIFPSGNKFRYIFFLPQRVCALYTYWYVSTHVGTASIYSFLNFFFQAASNFTFIFFFSLSNNIIFLLTEGWVFIHLLMLFFIIVSFAHYNLSHLLILSVDERKNEKFNRVQWLINLLSIDTDVWLQTFPPFNLFLCVFVCLCVIVATLEAERIETCGNRMNFFTLFNPFVGTALLCVM